MSSTNGAGGPPLLLVEDDRSQALLVERVLRKARLANPLHVCDNGEEAISYLAGEGLYADRERFPLPVVTLLDLHVPGKSGLDVLTWLREQPSLNGLPVVMLSGSSESEDIDRAFELGAQSYLVKPVAFDALVDAVSSLGLRWLLIEGDGGKSDE